MPIIEQVTIRNFGPITNATVGLSRLHALIGPNDSGKSMTLRAISHFFDSWMHRPTPQRLNVTQPSLRLQFDTGQSAEWSCDGQLADRFEPGPSTDPKFIEAFDAGGSVLRFDPDSLRAETPLIEDQAPLWFSDIHGRGLGALIDAIQARSQRDRDALTAHVRSVFPLVDEFRLFTKEQRRSVGVRLTDGTEVPAEHMSEGLLYFLGFAVLRFLRPIHFVAIEEPENGLHPARIAEIVRVLRALSQTTQVLLTTHSPLVINELQPHEVTLVTRTAEHGTTFTRMDRTPSFANRTTAFSLGELWLAYADGVSEEALLNPARR